MINISNKEVFVNTIMGYIWNRLEINDTIRLRGKDDTLTVDQVYQNYIEGVEKGYASNLCFAGNFYRTHNGEKVIFSNSEKLAIQELVRNYLLQTPISDYPNFRSTECDFVAIVLRKVLESSNNISNETKLRISKYIVALNALSTYLSFHSDIEGFIEKDDNKFSIKDHKNKKFINCTSKDACLEEFTPVVLKEDVYVVTLLDRETNEEEKIFVIAKENNSSFSEYNDAKYQVLSVQTLHNYLEEVGALFLERDLYDAEDLNDKLKNDILKYVNMSDEEKDKLDKLSDVATNWWTTALEIVNFCSLNDRVKARVSGHLNQADLEQFELNEATFKNLLKDEIKALILTEPFARIQSYYLNGSVFRRAFNNSDFELKPMYHQIKEINGVFTYLKGYFERVELVPDIMSGYEDIFKMRDFRTGLQYNRLYKEMDIVDGNIYVNNAKNDKVLIYSLNKDYAVLKRDSLT